MKARELASTLFEIASSNPSVASVKEAVKNVVESSLSMGQTANLAAERARAIVGASRKVRYGAAPAEFEDEVAEVWFPPVDEAQVAAANAAFFERLLGSYDSLVRSWDELKHLPKLPDDPHALRTFSFVKGSPIQLFADKAAIEGKKVLELGTHAGEIAKYLARYATAWIGVDDSTAALKLARLVCPSNAQFFDLSKQASLAAHYGSIDTVVGRGVFLARHLEAAKELVGFVEPFLVEGGRLFAELYFPNPDSERPGVYPAVHPPIQTPALFAYSRANVEMLIKHRPFAIAHDEERPELERRFVILEKLRADY